MSERAVALLRGINVGGKNKLAMKDLKQIFSYLGCTDVSTYIQSGNVIFRASEPVLKDLPEKVKAAIEESYGLKVPIVLRYADAWRATIAANPFQNVEHLHIMFLESPATNPDLLDPNRSPGDSFHIRGAEIYLHCPNGVGNSKLTNAYFDSKLKTISTGRNWRTVLEIEKLL